VDVGDDAEVVYSVAPDALVRVGGDVTDEAAADADERELEDTREAAPEPRGRAR
jgi:hypothetical protein